MHIDWQEKYNQISEKGFAVIRNLLDDQKCSGLKQLYDLDIYRSVINMERYRFGKGQYKYFAYPLPPLIHTLRAYFYESLYPLANEWMQNLNSDVRFPATHELFLEMCHQTGQQRPTPLILKYEQGGFNTLHQDIYGDVFFPFQVLFMLSQRDIDYKGGEFVMVEQIPRAQSKANVITLDKGDALIFTTQHRPTKGARGFYRSNMKHGISEVTNGQRYALGLIFHDAL